MKEAQKNRYWKFVFADALVECDAFTPTEIATITYLKDRADDETGYCYPNVETVNQAVGRSDNYSIKPHVDKAAWVGLLKVGGHGRKRWYHLTTDTDKLFIIANKKITKLELSSYKASYKPRSKNAELKLELSENSSYNQGGTNTSIDTSSNTPPYKEKVDQGGRVKNYIKEEMGGVPDGYKPNNKLSLASYPDRLREAKLRYNYLTSPDRISPLVGDRPFEDNKVRNFFLDWVDLEDHYPTEDLGKTILLILCSQNKISDLLSLGGAFRKLEHLEHQYYQDMTERRGFVYGKEDKDVVLKAILSNTKIRTGKEVSL